MNNIILTNEEIIELKKAKCRETSRLYRLNIENNEHIKEIKRNYYHNKLKLDENYKNKQNERYIHLRDNIPDFMKLRTEYVIKKREESIELRNKYRDYARNYYHIKKQRIVDNLLLVC